MREHTPGPWTWNEGRPAKYDLDWLIGVNGERILTIYSNGEITPNKALIAAAPDLLEMCETLYRIIPGIGGADDIAHEWLKLRDIIAKARGASEAQS